MKRRDFLRAFLAGLAGTFSARPFDVLSAPDKRSILAVARGDDPGAVTGEALRLLGGIKTIISPGDVVLIKPNMSWDRTPQQAANTNPLVVKELVVSCYQAGAKKVKIFDNTCNSARRVYKRSGIADAARKAGAEVSFMEERKFKKVLIGGQFLKEWPVYREALEVDKIINVPVAKHHSLSSLTLGMKNLMGLIGGRRNLLHQQIDANVVDLVAFFKPDLTVLDAYRILIANGPQGGNLKDVVKKNVVAASTDPVAVDAFGSTLFGYKQDELPFVRIAGERGLGSMNLDKVRILRNKTL